MAVTLHDIAKKAGLSVAAVSKALNNRPDISQTTAKKVRRIADRLGYTVNIAARTLVTRRTGVVGVIVSFPENPTVVERLRGIQSAAVEHEYLTSIAFHDGSVEKEIQQIRLMNGRVDGIVVTPSNQLPAIKNALIQTGLPVVLMNEPIDGFAVDFIGNDEEEGGRLAAEHAFSIGCRNSAYLGSSATIPSDQGIIAGLKKSLGNNNLTLSPDYILWGNTTSEATRSHVDFLMSMSSRPDFIATFSDLTAFWVLARLNEIGVRVPQDVSVIGYDNIEFTQLTRPTLTSISQPNMEIGRTALNTLMDRIEDTNSAIPFRRIVFRPELVIRDSTKRS